MRKIAYIICWVLCLKSVQAQDPNFSQFEMNPLYYNPAYTGDKSDLRIGINYRNLWLNVPGTKFPGPLSTYNVYGDKQFRNALVGGLGFFVMQNIKGEGIVTHTSAGFLYSWHVPTQSKDFHLYFGTRIYYNQLRVDFSRLVFSDQVDPERGYLNTLSSFHQNLPSNGVRHYIDIDAGMAMKWNLFNGKWSNELSFATAHLVKPDISLEGINTELPFKFNLIYNTSFPLLADKVYFNPKMIFEKQDDFSAYTYGFNIYVTKKYGHQKYTQPLYLGFYFRNPKINEFKNTKSFVAVIGHTGVFGAKEHRYQLGVSYDFTIGGLSMSTYGALELSSTLILNTKSARKPNRVCPQFRGNPLGPIN